MATPSLRELPLTSGSFTNTTNEWLYVYGTDTITLVDGSGKTVDVVALPAWVPPNFVITPTSAKTLLALGGSLEDFRGFLSKRAVSAGAPVVAGGRLQFSATVVAAALSESEVFADPPANLFTKSVAAEGEAWTHT